MEPADHQDTPVVVDNSDTYLPTAADQGNVSSTMSQPKETEGALLNHDEEGVEPAAENEQSSICSTCTAMLGVILPAGGMLFSILSIASTSIGAGILGLPDAFKNTGTVMSFFYLVVITAETVYSMWVLVTLADRTGLHSYEQLTEALLHKNALYFVAVIRWIYCVGAMVSYIVTVGNLLVPIMEDSNASDFLQGNVGIKLIQAGLWLVFFLPQCIPQEISALRYISLAGILMMIYFSLCVMVHFGIDSDERPHTNYVTTGNSAIDGLGVFIFSYMCQINCIEIYYEMCNRSPARFALCATISLTLCGSLYGLTGLFGYLNFGDALDGSILLQFNPIEQPYIMVSFIGVFIKVCASYGLYNNAACAALYQGLHWDPAKVSFLKHLIIAVSLAILSCILGVFIPNVNTVFGFTGGVCGGFLAFILPALYYMYCGDFTVASVGWANYIATYLMLMAGCVAVVFGTGSTIYGAV